MFQHLCGGMVGGTQDLSKSLTKVLSRNFKTLNNPNVSKKHISNNFLNPVQKLSRGTTSVDVWWQ